MIQSCKKVYDVDGESGANGRVAEWTVTLETDDFFEGYLEYLLDNHEPSLNNKIDVCGYKFDVSTYLNKDDIATYLEMCDMELLDDDYGSPKHRDMIDEFLDDSLPKVMEQKIGMQEYC